MEVKKVTTLKASVEFWLSTQDNGSINSYLPTFGNWLLNEYIVCNTQYISKRKERQYKLLNIFITAKH